MSIVPLQTVVSDAEKEALEIAKLLHTGHINAASARLVEFTNARKLTLWEQAAVADIAKAMNAGRKWKK